MLNKKFSGLALGTALILTLAGCGGSNTETATNPFIPSNEVGNPGGTNQSRIITVVPGATTISSLVTNVQNPNNIFTTGGANTLAFGANSLVGPQIDRDNFLTAVGTVDTLGVVFAVSGSSITPITVNPSTGALTAGAQSGAVNGTTGHNFSGGNASALVNHGSAIVIADNSAAPFILSVPILANNVIDNTTADSVTLSLTTGGTGGTAINGGLALTSLTNNADAFNGAGAFEGANGAVTQVFVDEGVAIAPFGTALSLSGGPDRVVADCGTVNANGQQGVLVTAAAPGVGGIECGTGIVNNGVAGGFVNAGVTINGATAGTVPGGFVDLSGQVGGATVVPTAITYVFNGNGQGGVPLFAVVGTNNALAPVVIIPINQQTQQFNGIIADGAQVLNQAFTGLGGGGISGLADQQGVAGLATFQGANNAGVNSLQGFDTENELVVIGGNGAASTLDAFGFDVNNLVNASSLFSDAPSVLADPNQVPLGVQSGAGSTSNPAVFNSFVP